MLTLMRVVSSRPPPARSAVSPVARAAMLALTISVDARAASGNLIARRVEAKGRELESSLRAQRRNLLPSFSVTMAGDGFVTPLLARSEEHTSELQSLMRTPSAVFCLKKT